MVGQYKPALLYLSLLGLVAATLQMVEYAHLHMVPEASLESSTVEVEIMVGRKYSAFAICLDAGI